LHNCEIAGLTAIGQFKLPGSVFSHP